MKKEIVVMHKRFSAVFNEELKAHGIKAKDFMLNCHINHDTYSCVKKVAM